ncbi:hypothetical protein CSUI_003430 [Cystoisospora suis]|uniref:Uncharacterized protein n=1 Tax=Cystoisospora suis TaxID=483139 RepID=A0A2C6L507_9APIC|nr:hypothetical protein CSUI_003430 [Cystoisospora suis]
MGRFANVLRRASMVGVAGGGDTPSGNEGAANSSSSSPENAVAPLAAPEKTSDLNLLYSEDSPRGVRRHIAAPSPTQGSLRVGPTRNLGSFSSPIDHRQFSGPRTSSQIGEGGSKAAAGGEGAAGSPPPHANAPLSWLKSYRSTHTVGLDRQKTYYSPYERETSLHCGVSRAFGGQEAGLSLLTGGSRPFGQAHSLENNNTNSNRQGPGAGAGGGGGAAPAAVGWSRKFTCEAPLLRPDSGAETRKPCCNRLATRTHFAQNGDGLALQSFRVEESPEKATSFRIKGIAHRELIGGETGGAGGDGKEGTSSTHPSPPSAGVRKGFTLRPVGTRADPDEAGPGGVDDIVRICDRDALPPESDKGQRADKPSRLERIYNKICSHPVYKFFSEGDGIPTLLRRMRGCGYRS